MPLCVWCNEGPLLRQPALPLDRLKPVHVFTHLVSSWPRMSRTGGESSRCHPLWKHCLGWGQVRGPRLSIGLWLVTTAGSKYLRYNGSGSKLEILVRIWTQTLIPTKCMNLSKGLCSRRGPKWTKSESCSLKNERNVNIQNLLLYLVDTVSVGCEPN